MHSIRVQFLAFIAAIMLVLLILLVQLFQSVGTWLSRRSDKRLKS